MNEIIEYNAGSNASNYLSPVVNVQTALTRYQDMKDFIDKVLNKDVDYGSIPGTSNKAVLLKPGAEKLAAFFGLTVTYDIIEKVADWTGKDHGGEPFFYFFYKCILLRNGTVAGQGEGSCNSWETKYRYRKAERTCPECGAEAIIKGKSEYGGGWICFAKKGGCGAKFKDGDPAIESQHTGRVANPDVADIVNTIQKMAQKRALVAAVLNATNASDWFTQDVEDYIDGSFTETAPAPAKPAPAKPQPKASSSNKRPLAPEKLKSMLETRAKSAKPATSEVQAEIIEAITGSYAVKDITTMLTYLFGTTALAELSPETMTAMYAWLGLSDGEIDPFAKEEIENILIESF
jgi:hypothetical protein